MRENRFRAFICILLSYRSDSPTSLGHQKLAPFPFLNIENKFPKEVLLYIVVGKNTKIVTYNIKKFVKFNVVK